MNISVLENLSKEVENLAKDGLTKLHHIQASEKDDVKSAIEIFERLNKAVETKDINELNKILSDATSINK